MKLENIKPAAGATKNTKRVGRGQGSGKGGTATRGTKGAKARSGYEHKIGFEGGQMPLQRRLPKFGFKNPTRVEYQAVSLASIQAIADAAGVKEIDVNLIKDYGFAAKTDLVKVLANGEEDRRQAQGSLSPPAIPTPSGARRWPYPRSCR